MRNITVNDLMQADTLDKMTALIGDLTDDELTRLNKETIRVAAERAILMMEEKVRLKKLIGPLTEEKKLVLLQDVNDRIDELDRFLVEYESLPRLTF